MGLHVSYSWSHLHDGGLVLVWQTLDADVAHEAGADGQEAYQGQEHLVQYSTVQYSTVQYSTVQYSTV